MQGMNIRTISHAWLAHLLCCMFCLEGMRNNPVPSHVSNIRTALTSLEKAAEFYTENFDKVNIDSVFGVRVAEGFLHQAVSLRNSYDLPHKLHTQMRMLYAQLANVADRSFQQLKSSRSGSSFNFDAVIEKEWFILLPYQQTDSIVMQKLIKPSNDEDDFLRGEESDKCMTDLIKIDPANSCEITNTCWQIMTTKKAFGYTVTHQALFILLAEKQGCREAILKRIGSVEAWEMQIMYLGYKIYNEIIQQHEEGFKESNKDLFIERVVVCQMLGVVSCFDHKYIELLVEWQDQRGCWKLEESLTEIVDEQQKANAAGMGDKYFEKEENLILRKLTSRKLQGEKILNDGCSSHLTGVATGLLGIYIYWSLNPFQSNSRYGVAKIHSTKKTLDTFQQHKIETYLNYNSAVILICILIIFACFSRRLAMTRSYLLRMCVS